MESEAKPPSVSRSLWLLSLVVTAVLAGALGYAAGQRSAPEGRSPTPTAPSSDDEGDTAAAAPAAAPGTRNPKWAAPLDKPGLPNLHQVSSALYRSAQPSAAGMQEAKRMGIKTVLNLRQFHSDRDEIGETGLAYEHIYFNPFNPEDKEVVRFLQIAADPSRQPVLVHCKHGADRTGTYCALYRICIEGWSKDAAIEELKDGGYGHHESIFGNLIKYIQELDIEAIKRRAGIPERRP
ncbi:MAG: hypothetical protein AMXMBFR7_35690 [Planctomycetota bacterium]